MQIYAEIFAYFRFYFYLCIVQSWQSLKRFKLSGVFLPICEHKVLHVSPSKRSFYNYLWPHCGHYLRFRPHCIRSPRLLPYCANYSQLSTHCVDILWKDRLTHLRKSADIFHQRSSFIKVVPKAIQTIKCFFAHM